MTADIEYTNLNILRRYSESSNYSRQHKIVRALPETFNQGLRQFNGLAHPFRLAIDKLQTGFFAVLNVVHLTTTTSNPLFGIQFGPKKIK